MRTRKWIGLGLCFNPIQFSRMDYRSLRRNCGPGAGYSFIPKAEVREGREGDLRVLFKGHNLGFSLRCCSNFPGVRFPVEDPLPQLALYFFLHSRICFVFPGMGQEQFWSYPRSIFSHFFAAQTEFSCLPEIPFASTTKLQ